MKDLDFLTEKENKLLDDYIIAKRMRKISKFHMDILSILIELILIELDELKGTKVGSEIYEESNFGKIERLLTQCKRAIDGTEVNDLDYFYKLKEELMENWNWQEEKHPSRVISRVRFERENEQKVISPSPSVIFAFSDRIELQEEKSDSDDVWGPFIHKLARMKKDEEERA